MKNKSNILSKLTPILGAGAIGICPICWIGSASLLTYLGLGVLISKWVWLSGTLFVLGLIGFALDYRSHKNPYPLSGLLAGVILLYTGRYVFGGEGFGGWHLWGPGAIIVLISVIYNKRLFSRRKHSLHKSEVDQ